MDIKNILLICISILLCSCISDSGFSGGGGYNGGESNGGGGNNINTTWFGPLKFTIIPESPVAGAPLVNNLPVTDARPYGFMPYIDVKVTNPLTVHLSSLNFANQDLPNCTATTGCADIQIVPNTNPLDCSNISESTPLNPGASCTMKWQVDFPINDTESEIISSTVTYNYFTYDVNPPNGAGAGSGMINPYTGRIDMPNISIPVQTGILQRTFPGSDLSDIMGEGTEGFIEVDPQGDSLYLQVGGVYKLPITYNNGVPSIGRTGAPTYQTPNQCLSDNICVFFGLDQTNTPLAQQVGAQENGDPLIGIYTYQTTNESLAPYYPLSDPPNHVDAGSISYIVNGLDRNLYLGTGYKWNGSSYVKLNMPNASWISQVSPTGVLVNSIGCYTPIGGNNYSFTPFIFPPGYILFNNGGIGAYGNNIWVYLQSIHPTFSGMYGRLGGWLLNPKTCTFSDSDMNFAPFGNYNNGGDSYTAKGVFTSAGATLIYYPYPPKTN